MPPVNLQLAAACLKDMPSPAAQGEIGSRSIPDPDVSEWSGLLVNEQEVAVHPVQAVDACMASTGNAIELTPLWPKKQASPLHTGRNGSGSGGAGWPADQKARNGRGTAPQPPPPLPSSCPPAVPTKSKNQPPPAPPPLPATSSREYRKQQESRRLANGLEGTDVKGPAPPPPVLQPLPNNTVTSQPLR